MSPTISYLSKDNLYSIGLWLRVFFWFFYVLVLFCLSSSGVAPSALNRVVLYNSPGKSSQRSMFIVLWIQFLPITCGVPHYRTFNPLYYLFKFYFIIFGYRDRKPRTLLRQYRSNNNLCRLLLFFSSSLLHNKEFSNFKLA